MEDEKRRKGSAVTKPIELRERKTGGPERTRPEKTQTSSREKMTSPATVSIITAGRSRKGAPKPEIIDQIGHRLRSVYNSVLAQPIPDRFHELLRELETGTSSPGAPNRGEPEPRSEQSKDKK